MKKIAVKPLKVLVTGGAGFIGSHLVEKLLSEGHTVSVIDDFSTGRLENLDAIINHKRFSLVTESVLHRETMKKLIQKVDIIYHLAASVGVKYVIDNPLRSMEINIKGTETVLELANQLGNKLVILASTSEVYGKNDSVPLHEDDDRILGSTYISRWGYSDSKAIDELLALAYYREKKLPVIITRFFNICGPRQVGEYGMVLPRFVKQALANQPITVYGTGNQSRCFCYVGDIVETLVRLPFIPKAQGEVFNMGNNQEIKIKELAKLVIKLAKSSSRVHYITYEKAYAKGFEDMQRRVPDITKIKRVTGFRPKVNQTELIKIVIEYFQKQEVL